MLEGNLTQEKKDRFGRGCATSTMLAIAVFIACHLYFPEIKQGIQRLFQPPVRQEDYEESPRNPYTPGPAPQIVYDNGSVFL